MPLFLHERETFADFLAMHKEQPVQKAVVYCFTGSQSELTAYIEMGLYIGITGWICDERRGKHLRELVRKDSAGSAHDRDGRTLPDPQGLTGKA